MLTLNPLRFSIAGLSLVAAMTSAQASQGLTISFVEDAASGRLSITLSGEAASPANTPFALTSGINQFGTQQLIFAEESETDPVYYFQTGWTWSLQSALPWTSGYGNPVSINGGGGFLYNSFASALSSLQLDVISTTDTSGGSPITWDGTITYLGSLEAIGLGDAQSGIILLTSGSDTLSIDWSATLIPVPEPSTYALALGLTIGGVALLRRRTRR